MNFPSAKEDPRRDRRLSLLAKLYFEIKISHFMCLVRNTKTQAALRFPASKQQQNNKRRVYPIYAAKMLGYHRDNKTTPERCLFSRRRNIYFSKKNFRYWSLPATHCYTTQDMQIVRGKKRISMLCLQKFTMHLAITSPLNIFVQRKPPSHRHTAPSGAKRNSIFLRLVLSTLKTFAQLFCKFKEL